MCPLLIGANLSTLLSKQNPNIWDFKFQARKVVSESKREFTTKNMRHTHQCINI